MQRQRSTRVSKHYSEKEAARIRNRESNHEAAAILRKGLLDMGIGEESLSCRVDDVRVEDELFEEEPEAQIEQFAKGFMGGGTESPSKRTRPSPSGSESGIDDDEYEEMDNGSGGFPLQGTTSEEACASMDSGASPASLTEEDYHVMDKMDDEARKRGEPYNPDPNAYGMNQGESLVDSNPWKNVLAKNRTTAGGGASARVAQLGGGAPAVISSGSVGVSQSGGRAPAAVFPKVPVKKGAKVRIASKQPIVRDLGTVFNVQPSTVPPIVDPIGLEITREKVAVQFLYIKSMTSEITARWSSEPDIGKKIDLGQTLMILSSSAVLQYSLLEVGYVILDFHEEVMTPESLRDSCVRASIVMKTYEDKASVMCITPGAYFHSMSVIRLIDNFCVVATRGFLGAGIFAIQRPASPAIAYPEAKQGREAAEELGQKVAMEKGLQAAFLRLSSPSPVSSSASSSGIRPCPSVLSSTAQSFVPTPVPSSIGVSSNVAAQQFVPTSVPFSIGVSTNVAMDAAMAAKEASQVTFFNANVRFFRFIFLIQDGQSGKERIERFNSNLGVDCKGSILKIEEIRQAMTSILQASSLRFLVGLSFFTLKLSAVCKGNVGSETDTTDSTDILLLQDFVISKATAASINGVSIMEKFDDDNFLKTAVRNFVSFLSLIGGNDWDGPIRQLTDWASGSGDFSLALGPAAYVGKTRLFFAKTIFAMVIKSIMSSDLNDSSNDIKSKVKNLIGLGFDKWANDINGLSLLMEHHSAFNLRQEALSIDMSKVLKGSKSRHDDVESPSKKIRKEDPKKDQKKRVEPKRSTPAPVTLSTGKPKYCVFYTGSWLFPDRGFKCSAQAGKPSCVFKHCDSVQEYISFYGSKELFKEAVKAGLPDGKMGKVRTELLTNHLA